MHHTTRRQILYIEVHDDDVTMMLFVTMFRTPFRAVDNCRGRTRVSEDMSETPHMFGAEVSSCLHVGFVKLAFTFMHFDDSQIFNIS